MPPKRKSESSGEPSSRTAKKSRAAEPPTAATGRPRRSGAAKNETARAAPVTEPQTPKRPPTKSKAETGSDAHEPTSTKKKTQPTKSQKEGSKPAASLTNQNGGVSTTSNLGPAHDRDSDEACYWLMKAEPESRFEKGVDVKFSVDDLAACTSPEPWDGVRNPMAQKNMRTMRRGDLGFFYHSNCKVPGIAGLLRIVHEHSVDESAFDPKHPYYDPKSSRDKPRWCVVHVEHVRTFDNLVPLRELQKHAGATGSLKNMQVLRMSRLSVSRVSSEEWEYILQDLVGLDPRKIIE